MGFVLLVFIFMLLKEIEDNKNLERGVIDG